MAQAKTLKELAAALGRPKSSVDRLTKKPWFPPRAKDGSWDVDEVKRAIASSEGRAESTPTAAEDERATLAAASDPVEQARAAVALASKRLAAANASGESQALEDLHAALAGLRNTEKAFMDLAERRGELVDRDILKQLVGEAVSRGVSVLERYEAQLANRVEEWVGDSAFLSATSEERTRIVRAWAREQADSVRSMTADELEKMIAAEVEERA